MGLCVLQQVPMISTIHVFSLFADIHHVHVEFIRFVVSLGSFFRISKEHCGKLSAYRYLVFSIKKFVYGCECCNTLCMYHFSLVHSNLFWRSYLVQGSSYVHIFALVLFLISAIQSDLLLPISRYHHEQHEQHWRVIVQRHFQWWTEQCDHGKGSICPTERAYVTQNAWGKSSLFHS